MSNWVNKSRKLLRDACTPWGIKASLTKKDNYGAIFTRDAVMTGIVGLLLKDDIIIDGFKKTLLNLRKLQGNQGQIASNFTVTADAISAVSYGTLSPKIDSCTWYMIGVGLLLKEGILKKEDFQESIEKVVDLLNAWEFNGKHLIYVPKGGNWADEYTYEGYILYDQLLRSWGLSLLGSLFESKEWSDKAKAINACLKSTYSPEGNSYFDSSFYPGGRFKYFDLAAHALAGIVFDNKNPFLDQSLNWINDEFIDKGLLPPAFYPVIQKGDTNWEILRSYHLFGFKNKPHHYHNGGIWWIWVGWLAVSLSLVNKKSAVEKLGDTTFKELEKLNDFNFNEYLSSDKMEPHGTEQLCYSASGILLMTLAQNGADFSILKN